MTKNEFKALVQKVITSNSSESAQYARELRNVLINASARRNKKTATDTCGVSTQSTAQRGQL